ncbi:MAG: PD-(D/E)XK nuclease family protein [Clostridia bacterium]|nr:PD-(D/E)XK nuclease family protein [Clostridia bacterium]
MIEAFLCGALSTALDKLKEIVKEREKTGKRTVIFCEDRLSLVAERTVCAAVEGTFLTSVYTFARFLSAEGGKSANVLSSQGSAMAVRRIIEEHKGELTLFKKLSSAGAAQSVYDTIALLYSSRIGADDVKAAAGEGFLGGKLRDLGIVYSAYEKFLEESGKEDRNGYLKKLCGVLESSAKIKGSLVIFLGFQAFTCTALECVRAAFAAAESVSGLFIGGKEDIYVNEAAESFCRAAEDFGGARRISVESRLCAEAEKLRAGLFNPESFYGEPLATARVRIFEAADEEEELEFIAASIKKHVFDGGERYAKISVMLPDPDSGERVLSRVFSRFKIPYYADRQLPLSAHPLCSFIINLLLCVSAGCRKAEVDAVISSPYFPAGRREKDVARNYILRLAAFRGGIKREPNKEICEGLKFDYGAVASVRKTFLDGFDILAAKCAKRDIYGGIRAVLELFGVENKLKELAEGFKDLRPTEAQFCARVYESVLAVLNEAEGLCEGVSVSETVKILKSGFAAMKVSLIPPKADAVFVGDLSATVNAGSEVIFAARLCGDVPSPADDTALLTDREIGALEKINLEISPKIRQVYKRKREVAALNLCAFKKALYLTYPVKKGGEESGASEIISYAGALFNTPAGGALKPVSLKKVEKSEKSAPWYCSEKLPAIKRLHRGFGERDSSSVYELLRKKGFEKEALGALTKARKRDISCGQKLFLNGGSVSPTALETYFACPYLNFMRQGLRAQEREEGAVRAADTGNLVHAVLEELAPRIEGCADGETFKDMARALCREKLQRPPYSSLGDSKSGQYTAGELVEETATIAAGMFEQIKNSDFTVAKTECAAGVEIDGGFKVFGRIDRVDESGEMVRVIDYKTGGFDVAAAKYYTGVKLQLPLYLLAVSEGKRAVGAYYFPAAVSYEEEKDGVFRLQGFMDCSGDVVSASDKNAQPQVRSSYVNAALEKTRQPDNAMKREDFAEFLEYSRLVAGSGAREMTGGNIAPSPAADACAYCKAGGSCGFNLGRDGDERKVSGVKCQGIAALVRRIKNGGDENE